MALTIVLTVVGCGPSSGIKYATVSGQVLLDGQPVSGARVRFMPQAAEGTVEAGHSSKGQTDAQGRFTLKTISEPETPGAAVGKHRVAISTLVLEANPNNPMGAQVVVSEETIPLQYSDRRTTRLTFEVPPAGTTEANFDLTSR